METASLKKGLVYLAFAQTVMMGSGFIIHFWVGRHLGPESYGIYGIVLALMGIFNLFLVWGVPRSLSKYLPRNETLARVILKKGLKIQFLFGLALGSFYFLTAPVIAFILKDNSLIPYLQFSALIIPCYAIFSIYIGYFNGLRFWGLQSFLTIFYSILKMASAIGLIYVFKVYGALAGYFIAPLVTFFIALPFSFEKGASKKDERDFPIKKLIGFALPFIGFAVLLYLQRELGLLLIKSFLKDNIAVGYYNAANTVAKVPYVFLETLALLALPVVAKTFLLGKIKKTKDIALKMTSFLFIVLAPASFLSYFTREEVLEFLYGKAYLNGSYIFPFLVLSFCILAFFMVFANIFAAIKNAFLPFLISVLMIALNFIFAFYFIPQRHLMGAAFATLFSTIIGVLIMSIILFREIGFFIRWWFILKIILISFISTFVSLFFELPLWFLPFEYVVIFAFYGLLLWLFREIKKEDILVLRDIILFKKD